MSHAKPVFKAAREQETGSKELQGGCAAWFWFDERIQGEHIKWAFSIEWLEGTLEGIRYGGGKFGW